jgi:hypothetical protein
MKSIRSWLIPVIAMAAVLSVATIASACPSCKAALGDSPEGQRLVRGYFVSICFMMAMPFTLLGGMSGYMYWLVRSARRDGQPGGPTLPSDAAAATPKIESQEPVGV